MFQVSVLELYVHLPCTLYLCNLHGRIRRYTTRIQYHILTKVLYYAVVRDFIRWLYEVTLWDYVQYVQRSGNGTVTCEWLGHEILQFSGRFLSHPVEIVGIQELLSRRGLHVYGPSKVSHRFPLPYAVFLFCFFRIFLQTICFVDWIHSLGSLI